MDKKTVVIGIGNLILKDEGVGVHAVKRLETMDLPSGLEVIDGGTDTMKLLGVFQDFDRIIVIDAIKGGGEPGTIYRVTPEEIMRDEKRSLSLHEVDLLDVLGMAKHLGGHGEVIIIGIEPKEISCSIDLTPEIESKLPHVIDAVFAEIN
ncbi:MAG: HyaD/HybD family hydrogenase maturation endopeptidase [bacterium]